MLRHSFAFESDSHKEENEILVDLLLKRNLYLSKKLRDEKLEKYQILEKCNCLKRELESTKSRLMEAECMAIFQSECGEVLSIADCLDQTGE